MLDYRITNWLCSVLFIFVSLAFPFLIAVLYKEPVPIKTVNMAFGMFVLTIATNTRNLFFFFSLLVFATYLFASYGAYKADEYYNISVERFTLQSILVYISISVAVLEKWHYHVVQDQPFLPFHKNIKKRF